MNNERQVLRDMSNDFVRARAVLLAIDLFEAGRPMNDIASALLYERFFSTHTQALVFASRVLSDRPEPRAVSRFSWPNFITGLILFWGGISDIVVFGYIFLSAPNRFVFVYLLAALLMLGLGLVLIVQEVLLRLALVARRRTDLDQLWKHVFKDGGPFLHTRGR